MIWSVIPEEIIFPQNRTEDMLSWRCMDHQGRRVLVAPGKDGTGVIMRLLSTDPQDYLDNSLAPGTKIPL